MAKTTIRKLTPGEPLPWEIQAVEPDGRMEFDIERIVCTVRFLVVSNNSDNFDMYGLSFNARDTTGNRPKAFGIPGGGVGRRETPLQALLNHEKGEIPWKRVGEPIFLFDIEGVRRDWKTWNEERRRAYFVEKTFFFLVVVDKDKYVGPTPQESQEISRAEFFSSAEIFRMKNPQNPNRPGQQQPRELSEDDEPLIYWVHQKKWFPELRRRYLEMRQAGEVP